MRYWQDLDAGETFMTEEVTLSKQDIIEFANEFDPQPYHLDPGSAAKSIFGGLCASGWQVCAILNRLILDTFNANNIAFAGTQHIIELRWKLPVYADARLSASIQIEDCQHNTDGSGLSSITCDITLSNQDQAEVLTQRGQFLIAHSPSGSTPGVEV